jgi:hypothetical protein
MHLVQSEFPIQPLLEISAVDSIKCKLMLDHASH